VLLVRGESLLRRSIRDENAEGAIVEPWELEALGLMDIAAAMDDPPRHMLAAPLFNREHELVGVLLLFETDIMDPALVRFTEALSGSAAISIETRQLIRAQRELFESFIQLIASAIDAKSPYTGGHCARVPELTKMLAAAADRDKTGRFADFTLSDADWEAIHVASWLHDCGKVTTPEFVVDKATKLETIYDRIHEIRMRIEVMKREAELAYWKRAAAEGESAEAAKALEETLAQLDDDFAFLAQCNVGGEFMADAQIERIEALAKKTWTRTLDDRLGVSHEEKERLDRTPPKPLPAKEPLLADRPDHLHARPEADRLPPDNPWGFKMEVPEYLYNRGEVHNLSVRKGTLTAEDRYKINEHIVQTIKMLDRLPFPKHLRHVPELAGGHHEKMDGTGYPKRLMKEDMSDVARMMAIADIFEALTAVDRPYKKGKTLSEALRIMTFMVRDQHIDADLFELFLTSGVYMDYARKYLRPEQIDEIDPNDYRVTA
jgi:HD-GYP domain-containing protein (c-di-GMP phosphodiesterase class II)